MNTHGVRSFVVAALLALGTMAHARDTLVPPSLVRLPGHEVEDKLARKVEGLPEKKISAALKAVLSSLAAGARSRAPAP